MAAAASTRTIVTLVAIVAGWLTSIAVYFEAFGPYLTWDGEPRSARILTLFTLPATAAGIHLVTRNLTRQRSDTESDSAADEAVQSIVMYVVLFLLSVQGMLLVLLLQAVDVHRAGPWVGRAVVIGGGLSL